jgi:hypothetical protein
MSNLVNSIYTYPNQIDSEELSRIKTKFSLRDRSNSENSDSISRSKQNPVIVFDKLSTPASLGTTTLRGPTYPLQLDGKGGISLSNGIDRIGQSIQEVLETRIGERVGNPYLGVRELLFETISEEVEAQSIRRQLLSAIPYLSENTLFVSMSIGEDGTCYVVVRYVVEGVGDTLVRYNYTPV